jgi:hypothetical protein
MKKGDLVLSKRFNAMGIVVEIFDDLGKENPWIRVLFTSPTETYQWCKLQGLTLVAEEKKDKDPASGSL